MLRRFDVNHAVFCLVMDALMVGVALRLADRWRPDLAWLPFSQRVSPDEHLPALLYAAAPVIWVLVLFLFSLYDPRAIFSASHEYRILVLGSGFAGLASAGLLYLSYRDVSRWLFLIFVAMAFIFLFVWRLTMRLLADRLGMPVVRQRRVVVVGTGEAGQHVGRLVEAHERMGLTLVGYVADAEPPGAPGASGKVLGGIAELRQIVQAQQVDEVVVALSSDGSPIEAVVNGLLDIPLHVRVIPTGFALALDRPAIESFAGVPMIDLRAGPLGEYQRFVKRLFDLATCSALTPIILPIVGLIALAIRLDSPGPVLFKQRRVGENGQLFTVYKFRTMVQDAEKLQSWVNVRDGNGKVIHKRPDDPRVTRVGRFLRRTSLDELPQLFNVLKGDMSLVGPRPELPWLVEQYEPWQRRRLVTPPGLTGWWQVNGRSDLPMHLHTDVDLYYVTNYSFWLDLRILWKTIWVVLQGKGAH